MDQDVTSTRWRRFLEQYSQFPSGFKSAISTMALDTLTTRFLLLFLFLLSIPLGAVIIFSVSLLSIYLEESDNTQLTLSQSLFEGAVSNYSQILAPLESVNHCQTTDVILCIIAQNDTMRMFHAASQTLAPLEHLPDLEPAIRSPLEQNPFYARGLGHLFLFRKSAIGNPPQRVIFRGFPIDDQFLRHLYQDYPQLQTAIWILEEPIQGRQPVWLGRSPEKNSRIPSRDILKRLQDRRLNHLYNQPISLEIEHNTYRVFQNTVYSINHQPIARVIHILPLVTNQTTLQNYYAGIYIISVASLLFSILLAMVAGRTITQPLLKLVNQVNKLSRENVMREKDEVPVSGVHEIRQLGEAFNRMVKRLRQEHKMKDEFVATLTHDLKVPMLAEKQTLQYFRQGVYGSLSDEQGEVLDILKSSNRSCLSLVNGLLEVYRYDSGEVSLVFEPFNLLRLLEETITELQSLAQEKSITLDMLSPLSKETLANEPENDEAMVFADRLEIKRVLHNLVSNAITNTPIHGVIRCNVTNAASHGVETVYKVSSLQHTTLKHPVNLTGRILVTVQDSGIGFANEDLPHLFRQFAASKGRNPMSIGLGLYNCYQVVQAHNGALWVESTEGEGSVVSFVLPHNKQTAQDRRVYCDRRKRP